MDNQILWLLAGALLVIAEFFVLPAVGFLFAGLGALVTGLLVETGVLSETISQWIAFFASSIILAALLWKPLKNYRQNKTGAKYQNMVGDQAVLQSALEKGKEGKAKWSGTVMKARLAEGAKDLAKGAEVEIVAVEGNVLVVK